MIGKLKDSASKLKRIFIEAQLPEELAPLREIAGNLWWSWNKRAEDIFKTLADDQWEAAYYNPLVILDNLTLEKIDSLKKDKAFMKELNSVYADFKQYMSVKPKRVRLRSLTLVWNMAFILLYDYTLED